MTDTRTIARMRGAAMVPLLVLGLLIAGVVLAIVG